MELLNQPINSFTFDDIVKFCSESHTEGIQLDYKRELPKGDMSKHFAAFSNTRGGIIIIGVDEHEATGKPKAWEGVTNEGKLEDRIHQYASNVEPIPLYEVHVTDEQNGKVFILIRIFEGDRTPYYVQNDANLWVRTGNISKSIDNASSDAAELLFGKKDKAELARTNYRRRAQSIFDAALRRIRRGNTQALEKQILCTIVIQPFYPRKALIGLPQLLSSLREIASHSQSGRQFPELSNIPESIQDGILRFEYASYMLRADQIFSSGLVYYSENVVRPSSDGKEVFYIAQVALYLYLVLEATRKFYVKVGYQGSIKGFVSLKNTEDADCYQIGHKQIVFGAQHTTLLSEYEWEFELDTVILNNRDDFKQFYVDRIREIHWGLGFPEVRDDAINSFLSEESIFKSS